MTEASWKTLRTTLVERYDELSGRLARYLGSRDSAENALHDTYLRLMRENLGELGEVRNPRSYLLRMALNVAASNKRSEPRWLSYGESVAFIEAMDDQLGPEDVSARRSDLCLVERLIEGMPPRRRAIFEESWLDELPQKEIAARHNLTVRSVQIELKQAMAHVADRLAKSNVVDFVSEARKASSSEREAQIATPASLIKKPTQDL